MKLYALLNVLSLILGTSSAFVVHRQQAIASKTTTTTTTLNIAGAQEAWSAYNDALQSYPLLTKSVTAGAILGAADIAGQALENKQKGDDDAELDIARTVRFAFFGLVLQAPWNHFYYMVLDGTIPPTEEPFTPTTGIKVRMIHLPIQQKDSRLTYSFFLFEIGCD